MKQLLALSIVFLPFTVFAQQTGPCRDVVVLRNGSTFRGTVTAYQHDGELEMTTWSGSNIRVASSNVRRVTQKCSDEAKRVGENVGFLEKGWYTAPRLSTYWADQEMGLGLQISSGRQFNRMIGAGIGVGIEKLSSLDNFYYSDVVSFPIFAEARGYLTDKFVTPYYALGLGWALAGKSDDDFEGSTNDWKGGWLSQWQLGLRIGDHFTVHTGLRFQRKTRTWSRWWGVEGEDRIFQRRFEFGIGLVF